MVIRKAGALRGLEVWGLTAPYDIVVVVDASGVPYFAVTERNKVSWLHFDKFDDRVRDIIISWTEHRCVSVSSI